MASLIIASFSAMAGETPREHFKIAVQALPHEANTSLDGGDLAPVPRHFFTFPGDHEVMVGAFGFGETKVPLTVTDTDMFVEVRLKRKRGHYSGWTLFSFGASAVLPGLVFTVIGAANGSADENLLYLGAPLLGAGFALALTGGILLLFGGEREPEIFVAPLLDLGSGKQP